MPERPRALGPAKLALSLEDWLIIDAGEALPHQALCIKLPVLVAVGAEPVACVVAPLIGKAHRDTILRERPQFFYQAIVQLTRPLVCQKRDNLSAAGRECSPVAPAAVDRLGKRHAMRVARVPSVLGQPDFLDRSLPRVWR